MWMMVPEGWNGRRSQDSLQYDFTEEEAEEMLNQAAVEQEQERSRVDDILDIIDEGLAEVEGARWDDMGNYYEGDIEE